MNKKILLIIGVIFTFTLSLWGQQTPSIKFYRTADASPSFSISVTPGDASKKVDVDWGDGTITTVQGNAWSNNISINGEVKGNYVTIIGLFSKIDVASSTSTKNAIERIEATGQDKLSIFEAKGNAFSSFDVSLFPELTSLDMRENNFSTFELRGHDKLEYLTISNNKLTSLYVSDCQMLKGITADNNDITTISCENIPNINSLSLINNSIISIDLSKMPKLRKLSMEQNGLSSIDLSQVPELEKVYLGHNFLTSLVLDKNPNLVEIAVQKNLITTLILPELKQLTRLNVRGNKIKELNVSLLARLTELSVGANEELADIDVSQNIYLKKLYIDSTAIAGLDISQNNSLDFLDIRKTRVSECALKHIISLLPERAETSYVTNFLVANTPWLNVNIQDAVAKKWKPDVDAALSQDKAVCNQYTVTFEQPENGSIRASLLGNAFNSGEIATAGSVVRLYVTPNNGYEVAAITYTAPNGSGQDVELPLIGTGLVVENNTTVKVQLKIISNTIITLTSNLNKGTAAQLFLRQSPNSTEKVQIDWGNGVWQNYDVTNVAELSSAIEGIIEGNTIRIKGAVDKIIATELAVTDADFSHNTEITYIDLYMNELETLDLSKNKKLNTLNIAYNNIKSLSLTNNTELQTLVIYNNAIEEIDLSANTKLIKIDAKNLSLSTISINSSVLETLDLQNNQITDIDLTTTKEIRELRISGNKLTTLNTKDLANLEILTAGNNKLTEIDLKNNLKLRKIYLNDNNLSNLTFSKDMTDLVYIDCGDNGMSACALDSMYMSLPVWNGSASDQLITTLFNKGTYPDKLNQSATSKTFIATQKGWKPAENGDGSGCNTTLIDDIAIGKDFNYYTTDGGLILVFDAKYADTKAYVYDSTGICVSITTSGTERYIPLLKGFYFIMFDKKSFKVTIR